MKKLASLLLGTAMAFGSVAAFADDAPSNPGAMTKALEALQSKGYVIVKKIEFDKKDGVFKAKVANAEGKNLHVTINATTFEMIKGNDAVEGVTALEVSKTVTEAGYPIINEIDTEMFSDKYEVKAFDAKGKEMEIKVDAKTGKILKTEND